MWCNIDWCILISKGNSNWILKNYFLMYKYHWTLFSNLPVQLDWHCLLWLVKHEPNNNTKRKLASTGCCKVRKKGNKNLMKKDTVTASRQDHFYSIILNLWMQGALQIVLYLVWWSLDIALTQLNIHYSEIAKLFIHWLVLYEGSDIVLLLPLYLVWICLTTNMTHDMNNSAIHYSI